MCELPNIFLGVSESEEGSEIVKINSQNRYTHAYICGATGTGKSTMIANMAVNDISNGNSVVVVDPAGSLADTILCAINDEDLERVIYCSIDYPQCFNLFELKKDKGILIEDFFSLVDKVVVGGTATQALTARMRDVFRTALEVVLKGSRPTFYDLYRFLTDQGFRERLLGKYGASDFTKEAWKKGGSFFPGRQPDVSVTGCIDRLRMFIGSRSIERMCCGRSSFDFDDILDGNKVFLVNLDKSGNFMKFLGCLFLHGLQSTILYTSRKARPVAVYCDEFELFITPDFYRFFNEGRKYKASMCLAHQVHSSGSEQIVNAALSNCSSKIAFRSGSKEAGRISREFVGVGAEEIVTLERFHVYCGIDSRTYHFKAKRAPFEQRGIEDVDNWLEQKFKPPAAEAVEEDFEFEEGEIEEESIISEPVFEEVIQEEERYVGYEWFKL